VTLPEPPRPDIPPPYRPPSPKPRPNWLIIAGSIVGGLIVLGYFVASSDSGSDTDQQKENSQEVCAEVRQIAADADLYTQDELRSKVQEVYDGNDIVLASIPIRNAVRDVLSALTSGDIDAFQQAVDNVDNQCSLVGA
jgi:hypothetical protein